MRATMIPVLSAMLALCAAWCSGAGGTFSESRLITPAQGAQLNRWANRSVGQAWALCYTSLTMNKTSPADFHRNCDAYRPTFSVAHNSGGRPFQCIGRCSHSDPGDPQNACPTLGSKCSGDHGTSAGVCQAHCPDGLFGNDYSLCSASAKIGDHCGPTNPGNFTFGGFVRPSPSLHSPPPRSDLPLMLCIVAHPSSPAASSPPFCSSCRSGWL